MSQDNKNIIENQSINFGLNRLGSLQEIMEAGRRYPYSLPVQAYLAKILRLSNGFDYERFEKISAVLSPDRQWLYNFIQASPGPIHHNNSKQTHTQAIEPVIEIVPETNARDELKTSSLINSVPGPLTIDLPEVELPGHEVPVMDDGSMVIEQALQETVLTPEKAEETIVPQAKTVETAPVKVDPLEREILKEAIDKTIQKEVGEMQPAFETRQEETPVQQEDTPGGFQYWLNPQRKKTQTREEKLRKIDALIEKFIRSEPKIVPKKTEFFSPVNAAKQSVAVNEDLVSEPLALIFEKQGYFDKAIKAYEKLSLKIPEKRAYFATRIEKIKEIVKNIKNNKE